MEKVTKHWYAWVIGVLLAGVYLWGSQNMYFHQDDLDWFLLVNRPWGEVLAYPVGDHVNYLFRLLMFTQWRWFGFNFAPYFMVSVIMHAIVIGLIYALAKASSGRRDLAAMAALIFTVNTNWTEVVLWTAGQTISITAIFVLLAMLAIWHQRGERMTLLLSSWTSALSLGMLMATGMTYKRLRMWVGIVGVSVAMIYYFWGGDGTSLPISLNWVWQVVVVAALMVINTVVGRVIIPFDRFEGVRIVVVMILLGGWIWRNRQWLIRAWSDVWSRFLLWQIFWYYLIVAAGRAQFGIGIMRAERYAYIGLALLLLWIVRVMRKETTNKWWWVVALIVGVQILGFYHRSQIYIERPKQLKTLVEQLRSQESTRIEGDDYLPRFVLNDDRLKYSDLMGLINH